MTDFGDDAQRISERDLWLALQKRAARQRPETDNRNCNGCGREIPAARRAAVPGALLCVGCAADVETRSRR